MDAQQALTEGYAADIDDDFADEGRELDLDMDEDWHV